MNKLQEFRFCPGCFADEVSGSWGHVVVSGYCTNCGNSRTVYLPRWAIDSIREQASWVGKRFYRHAEDDEAQAEREALLKLVTSFPGRRAYQPNPSFPREWIVRQELSPGRGVCTTAEADTAEEAMRKSGLRYVPEPGR